ncbi:hypothetical protein PCI56_24950 [Plesiomonas shigelloides subsp. oncorhynchi]|nr:hypothetical protein [Plesiomonas shigelloides]
MLIALMLTGVVVVVIGGLFTCSRYRAVTAPVSDFNAWDEDLKAARALRDLAARCKAARECVSMAKRIIRPVVELWFG